MNASTVTKTNRAYGLVRRSKPYYHTTGGGGKEEQQQEQEQEQEEGRRRNGPAELRLSKRGQSRQAKCSCRGARPGCRGKTGGGRGGVSGTVRQPTWTPQASQITDLRINAGQKVYDRYTKNSAVQHHGGVPRICRCHPQWPLRQAPPAPVLPERNGAPPKKSQDGQAADPTRAGGPWRQRQTDKRLSGRPQPPPLSTSGR